VAEREIQDIKKDVAMVMNLTNTPGAFRISSVNNFLMCYRSMIAKMLI
jgi:hypothetical protein